MVLGVGGGCRFQVTAGQELKLVGCGSRLWGPCLEKGIPGKDVTGCKTVMSSVSELFLPLRAWGRGVE